MPSFTTQDVLSALVAVYPKKLTRAQIASALGIPDIGIGALLYNMERKGFIKRWIPAASKDKLRIATYSVSVTGLAYHDRAKEGSGNEQHQS